MNTHASPIHLSPPIRRKLVKISHSQTAEHRSVLRSNIILRAAAGESNAAISRSIGCTEKTVRKWRDRFAAESKAKSLEDLPRKGRPARIPAAIRCEIVKLACKRPSGDAAPFRKIWTVGSLAQTLEFETNYHLSETEIRRILNDADIHPHRIRMWLHSPDPHEIGVPQQCLD
ncbi:helix-turn-helix domain-containing protein [Oligoflexus sp.]|uniref:helix-turn-helix domain-containing protein n=1 Tax=Oligoflexus sp. TaxID=1971216 RepID=UPI0039C8C1BF